MPEILLFNLFQAENIYTEDENEANSVDME